MHISFEVRGADRELAKNAECRIKVLKPCQKKFLLGRSSRQSVLLDEYKSRTQRHNQLSRNILFQVFYDLKVAMSPEQRVR